MTPAGHLFVYGAPVAVFICAAVWWQKFRLRHPPKTAREAEQRALWASTPVLSQFGVRISRDRFIYGPRGILGPLDGATASIVKSVPITKLKPSTGWCVITFADGTVHRQLLGLRNLDVAQAQLAKFEALAASTPAGQFKRTRPAHQAP